MFQHAGSDDLEPPIPCEMGVTIHWTIPAVHIFDGCVRLILEWHGLKFCYGSDSFPNEWWMEHAKSANISIHGFIVDPLRIPPPRLPQAVRTGSTP